MLKYRLVHWLGIGAASVTLLQLGGCNLQNPLWLGLAGLGGLFAFSQIQ